MTKKQLYSIQKCEQNCAICDNACAKNTKCQTLMANDFQQFTSNVLFISCFLLCFRSSAAADVTGCGAQFEL